MATPKQIAAFPSTPGSVILARGAFLDHVEDWTLIGAARWHNPAGTLRHSAHLHLVCVIYDAAHDAHDAARQETA